MKPNPFRQCLEELDAADNAWLDGKGVEQYALWANSYAGLLRGAITMLAEYVDSARRKAEAEGPAVDNVSPAPPTVYN